MLLCRYRGEGLRGEYVCSFRAKLNSSTSTYVRASRGKKVSILLAGGHNRCLVDGGAARQIYGSGKC